MNKYRFWWSLGFLLWRIYDCVYLLLYPIFALITVLFPLVGLFAAFATLIEDWTPERWFSHIMSFFGTLLVVMFFTLILVALFSLGKKFANAAKKHLKHIIRYVEIGHDKIVLVLISGRIVLEHIKSVEYVTKAALDTAKCMVPKKRRNSGGEMVEHYGLTMEVMDFIDPKYGCFTRICNNFSELAMVTCVDGKKFLINYPKKIIIPQEKD